MKILFAVVAVSLVLVFSGQGRASENTCVTCHQTLETTVHLAHDFSEWKQSAHASNEITCEQCHGGDPSESDSQKAHAGFIPAKDPKSPLYFRNIPETCGRCHTREAKAFQSSYHAKELHRSGRGPNCTTCHGAMATAIFKPEQLEQRCSICHTQRSIASEALVTLNLAGSTLKKWEQLIGNATDPKLETTKAQFSTVQERWHAFDMKTVITEARKIVSIANHEMQTLRLKQGGK